MTAREQYLLFAGTQPPPNGGLGDPLETFTSEEAARRAFRDVRLRMSSPASWAQLAVVDDAHGLKPMCWFGTDAEPEPVRSSPGRSSRARPTTERNGPLPKTSMTDAATALPLRPRLVTFASWLLALVIVTALLLATLALLSDGSVR